MGRWTFLELTMNLHYFPAEQEVSCFDIALGDIHNSAGMLDCIFQVRGKSWATDQDVLDLLAAFDQIFDPQTNLCPRGKHKTIDPIQRLVDVLAQEVLAGCGKTKQAA